MSETFIEKFQGKEFWRTLNLIIFFFMYAVMFIVPVFFPDQLWVVAVICAFLIMLYVTVQQFVYRKMEKKNAGRRVLYGWIDEEEDMGEEYEIPIKKISPFERLSESDQIAVEEFMKSEKEKMSAIGLQESELNRYIREGYSRAPIKNLKLENKFKKQTQNDENDYDYEDDPDDIGKYDKEDREEFMKWLKEKKKIEEVDENGEN